MSKLSGEAVAVIGHTGKDVDPEMKRLTNLGIYKTSPKVAEFFAAWDADSDFPQDRLFGGRVVDLQPTAVDYDPDDPASWAWNLNPDLFSENEDWESLLRDLHA